MDIEKDVPLAPLTTFRFGGPARFFVFVSSIDELRGALAFANEKKLKTFILGGGSNVLVADEGFDGLVIKIELAGVERQQNILIAAAGESWDGLVARAVSDGLWGIENLSGIPGTVGGAVVQNIGAYGAALSQTLMWVEAFDTTNESTVTLHKEDLHFGYRASVFKEEDGRYVVLRAAFELSPTPAPNLAYKDLALLFAAAQPSLSDIRTVVLNIRAGKFPDLSKEGTAGSFFLNPVVPAVQAAALQKRYPEMPLFAMPETSDIKVPLGWILDHVLNLRGFTLGNARLFEKQALVIAASRDARASDVRALSEKIKKEVKEKIGIEIKEEVKQL